MQDPFATNIRGCRLKTTRIASCSYVKEKNDLKFMNVKHGEGTMLGTMSSLVCCLELDIGELCEGWQGVTIWNKHSLFDLICLNIRLLA